MKTFGETIRGYREERKLPLRKVAAGLDIDQAILSKIERGVRQASREMVMKLSEFFNVPENSLLVAWLSDKLVYEVQDETVALQALQIAEERIAYGGTSEPDRKSLIKCITEFFKKDGRVSKAWLFGSYARGEERIGSDIDLMVSYSSKASGTLLDYADITFHLESILKRKVDLVEEGFVKSFATTSINEDKILIYG
jgi:predicted nucleotidyltransferase